MIINVLERPHMSYNKGARSPASLVISSVWKPYMKHNCELDGAVSLGSPSIRSLQNAQFIKRQGELNSAGVATSSCRKSSTFLSESGNLKYSITASWMISGLVLKHLKGERLVMNTR